MPDTPFCQITGSPRFADALNQTFAALQGTNGPGLDHLADHTLQIFVQGGKWKGCWSQNYFGMCCTTPLLSGRQLDYHLNTLALFFSLQGDGVRQDENGFTAPPGALPEYVTLRNAEPGPRYKNDESSGLAAEFDFWVEGNAASVHSLCDVLLAKRDLGKTLELLPKIEKCLAFILSRKDPATGLLQVGPAGTFIERAYGATYRSKGVTEYGLPSGAAVNTIQALRLAAEVEEYASRPQQAAFYRQEADDLQKALARCIEKDSFLINYLDADGIRHGVPGADKHSYFEITCNHDAAAWGVVPEKTAVSILKKILEVSPTPLCPCVWEIHDDSHWSYQTDDAAYGHAGSHWNGAAWFSSQARYAYALLKHGFFDEACALAESMQKICASGVMRDVMDLYGKAPIGDNNPDTVGNYYIDAYGTFGGILRGAGGVEYKADTIRLTPHIPGEAASYKQSAPYFWGEKKLFIHTEGTGTQVLSVSVNGQNVDAQFIEGGSVTLDYATLPSEAEILFTRM